MSPDDAFALLITWSCYGTWLPGDRRGYVSNTRERNGAYEPKQNTPGTPYTRDHAATRQTASAAQKYATASLDSRTARVAATAIIDACREREWHVVRAAFMWNHVHVIVGNCPDNGPLVRRVLKGVSQNALSKHAAHARRWWTAGGTDRYLHGDEAIAAATRYVADQHGILAQVVNMQVL